MSVIAAISEKEFLQQVRDLARLYNWLCFHCHDSRRSVAGFPDLLLLRGQRQIVAELKVGNRRPTPEQTAWLQAFTAARVEAYTWWPTDWTFIEETLRP